MEAAEIVVYVAPDGRNSWTGSHPDPDSSHTDGPFASIERACTAVRERRGAEIVRRPATIVLRGGRHELIRPLQLGIGDDDLTFSAYPGEHPVIDGGVLITDWREGTVNGVRCWMADLPAVRDGNWYFRQLFVDGKRRLRARLPKSGFFRMADVPGTPVRAVEDDIFKGSNSFICHPGDIRSWHNLSDVEVVAYHYWCEERMPIVAFDPESNLVSSSRRSTWVLRSDVESGYAQYVVENVFEALSEPGEWYLDREVGRLTYIPFADEVIEQTTVIAPRWQTLVQLAGDPDGERSVEKIRFQGISFHHTDWQQPETIHPRAIETDVPMNTLLASAPQAAFDIPGAIILTGARACAIEGCEIAHVGGYGIELGEGSFDCHIVGNHLYDLGAGGIKLDGVDANGPVNRRVGRTRITDNHVHAGGHIFPSAVGILLMHAFETDLSHNHIHDLHYSGISVGWQWNYDRAVAANNRIEHNHIHDLGSGLMSDMGGIYLLGVQPGTVIRNNLVHAISKRSYGGWGIYLDEGSAHILVENNICFDVGSQGFHQHYGRENIVRNNIFAFGQEGQLMLSRAENGVVLDTPLLQHEGHSFIDQMLVGLPPHNSFTAHHNILLMAAGQVGITGGHHGQVERRGFLCDLNLYWSVAGEPVTNGDSGRDDRGQWHMKTPLSWEAWQSLGYDRHSIVSDPGFRDAVNGDFTFADNSPAHTLGIQPIDHSQIGPRQPEDRRDRYAFSLST